MRRARGRLPLAVAIALVLAAAAAAGTAPAQAQATPWQVVELRALHETDHTTVADVNGAGVSVGSSGPTPVQWDADGTPHALPMPPGWSLGWATALNEQGHIVGVVSSAAAKPSQGVLWRDGGVTLLGELLEPTDVTEFGAVVGRRQTATGLHAFALIPGGEPIDLADGGYQSEVVAANDRGVAAGSVLGIGGLQAVATGWYGTAVFALLRYQPLGSYGIDVTNANVFLVNIPLANGPVVGLVGPGGTFALLNHDGMVDQGVDLNERSIAVGFRSFGPIESREGVFYAYGAALPLRTLVSAADVSRWNLQFPVALNDDLWVVGNTFDPFHDSWLLRPP